MSAQSSSGRPGGGDHAGRAPRGGEPGEPRRPGGGDHAGRAPRGGEPGEPRLPTGADSDAAVFVISVAAELAGMHAQTLRGYDRMGLVSPGRARGGGRRYSARDIGLLREVQRLSQVEGVNLAGVKRIIELEQLVDELKARVDELSAQLDDAHAAAEHAASMVHASYRRELVPISQQGTALVVWKPKRDLP